MGAGVRSRRLLALSFAIAAMLLASGCNRSKKRTIAVIPKGTSHLFWISVRAGAMAAGEKFNVDILWNGPAQETEYGRQIQIVDSMAARHVDGIAVAVTERKALAQSINRAIDQGIPVTVFDSGVDSDKYLTFLATDNYEAGQIGARELGRLLNGQGTAALLMNAPGSGSTMDRERGFEDVMKREFPKIQVVARLYGQSDRAKARTAAENILTAHPDLGGIFASAEPSSVGTALALKSRNLTGKVKFVAFDSSDTLVEDLKAGVIDAMVVQDPYHMGFEAVKTLIDKLNGVIPPKQIDLHARLIRKPDLDQPEIQQLLLGRK